MDLNGKVAVVTGASVSVGREFALEFARQGARVVCAARREDKLKETVALIEAESGQAIYVVADVTDQDQVTRLLEESLKTFGQVDILVNNAVSSLHAPFAEQTDDHWRHHLDVKLMAYIRAARMAIAHMRASGGGRIVNVGGMTARIVTPIRITNGVVNAGVANFTKQLSAQIGADGITVNCVHPGFTATERMMNGTRRRAADSDISEDEEIARMVSSIPLGRLVAPQDIANMVLFFCSPLASMVTGQSIAVDGGSAESINY